MRYLKTIFAAVALATATACTNNDVVSPNGTVVGSWNLRTINGSTLPYFIDSRTELMSEQLNLYSDGTYADVASYSDGTTFTENGFYTVNNNAITFNDQTDRLTYSGSVSGDVLTEISGSFTSVYQRD
jgi:hypothetical protein